MFIPYTDAGNVMRGDQILPSHVLFSLSTAVLITL